MSKSHQPSAQYPYIKRWRYERARGLSRQIDPGPTLRHVESLVAAGGTVSGICEIAGISPEIIGRLASGRNKQIRRATAAKILSIKTRDLFDRERPEQLVPAVGTIRRIQALMALGHTHATIAEAMGVPGRGYIAANITKRRPHQVSQENFNRVVKAYDALWDKPGKSVVAARHARAAGLLPPLAWDDGTIDDPAARPQGVGTDSWHLSVDDIDWFLEQEPTATAARVAERFGVKSDAVQQCARRAHRPDLLDRLVRNAELAGHNVSRAS